MQFAQFLEAGVETLAGFDAGAALNAGLSPARVRDLGNVHEVYFGKTKFTRKQSAALRAAVGHSLDKLVLIERKLKNVEAPGEKWRLRLELLRFRGRYDALSRHADSLIDAPAPAPKKQARFTKPRGGMRSLHLTYNEHDMTDLEFAALDMVDTSSNVPVAEQTADAIFTLLRNDAVGGLPRAIRRPVILLPLEDFKKIEAGDGDDIQLPCTDGTTITGAEYLQMKFGDELELAAVHPQQGPVNLYRAKRFASEKQRVLAKLLAPACPFPGCRHSADACEIHHVQAWKHGGETNVGNLVPLCRYHNGVNDDDPNLLARGHIEIRDGAAVWVSPRGHPVPLETPGATQLLFGSRASSGTY